MLAVVREIAPLLISVPDVAFRGPIDTVVAEAVIADAEAVVREALTDVVKHAHAGEVRVEVTAASGRLRIGVTDNGVGIANLRRRSGLKNLRHRAVSRGGALEVRRRPEGGTAFAWTVPLVSG